MQLWVQACQHHLNKLFSLYQGLLNWLWLHCGKIAVIFPLTHTNPPRAGEQRNIRGMEAMSTGREARALLNGSKCNCTHQRLMQARLRHGCRLRPPSWSLGLWVPMDTPFLPNSIVSSMISGKDSCRAEEGWLSLSTDSDSFVLCLAHSGCLSLHPELNTGALKYLADSKIIWTQSRLPFPQQRPVGKEWHEPPPLVPKSGQRSSKPSHLIFGYLRHYLCGFW